MEISGTEFLVLEITQANGRITIARWELEDMHASIQNVSTTSLNHTLFNNPTTVENLTMTYGPQVLLPGSLPSPVYSFTSNFNDRIGETQYYIANDSFLSNMQQLRQHLCAPVQVLALRTAFEGHYGGIDQVQAAVKRGFDVNYYNSVNKYKLLYEECQGSGGRCGSNTTTQGFVCRCRHKPHRLKCTSGTHAWFPHLSSNFLLDSNIIIIHIKGYFKYIYP